LATNEFLGYKTRFIRKIFEIENQNALQIFQSVVIPD